MNLMFLTQHIPSWYHPWWVTKSSHLQNQQKICFGVDMAIIITTWLRLLPPLMLSLYSEKKKKKEEVPAQLAFCNSNHLRPPGLIPSQGQQLTFFNAGTLQSIEITTEALSLLALRCEKKGKCFLGEGRTERIELFNRNPQSLGAIWPGGGPAIRRRKMQREYKVWKTASLAWYPEPFISWASVYLSVTFTQLGSSPSSKICAKCKG